MRTAQGAVAMLSSTTMQVLESNLLIAQRLASIEVGIGVTMKPPAYIPPTMTGFENEEPVPESYQRDVQGFAFEEQLNLS